VAVCQREMKAIENPKRPLRPEGIVGPAGYQPDRALKLSVCRDYLKVVDHILPTDACQIPILWHKDLHLDNIFVNPEKPTEIVGLIDWQNSYVAPLFDQVSHPAFWTIRGRRLRVSRRQLCQKVLRSSMRTQKNVRKSYSSNSPCIRTITTTQLR
jgi:aminoglycoside phosphotransferase (APT) family kinase protein